MNPAEITAITAATKEITGVIKGLFNWRAEKTAQKQIAIKAALISLVLAADETRQYFADVRRDPAAKSFEREHKLSALWANAGMDMMSVNNMIANTYLLKADYWSDPAGWTKAAKDERAIQLDEVYRLGREAVLGI